MVETYEFKLKKEHVRLLPSLNFRFIQEPYGNELIPQFDMKRLFGDPTGWETTARLLDMVPQDGEEYTEKQILTCKKLVIELILAMEVVFKYRTFEPGRYLIHKINSSYLSYRAARNYLYVEGFLNDVTKPLDEWQQKKLKELAYNINCDLDDRLEVYKQFLKILTFHDPKYKEKMPSWIVDIAEKLEVLIADWIRDGDLWIRYESPEIKANDHFNIYDNGKIKWVESHFESARRPDDSSRSYQTYSDLFFQLRNSSRLDKKELESILDSNGKNGLTVSYSARAYTEG